MSVLIVTKCFCLLFFVVMRISFFSALVSLLIDTTWEFLSASNTQRSYNAKKKKKLNRNCNPRPFCFISACLFFRIYGIQLVLQTIQPVLFLHSKQHSYYKNVISQFDSVYVILSIDTPPEFYDNFTESKVTLNEKNIVLQGNLVFRIQGVFTYYYHVVPNVCLPYADDVTARNIKNRTSEVR